MTDLHLSQSDVLMLAFEDVVDPSVLYALALPVVMWIAQARHAFSAGAASLAGALVLVALMPSLEGGPWATAALTTVLGVLCLLYWRNLLRQRGTRGEAEVVLALLGLVSVLFGLVLLCFEVATRAGGSGVRPLLAAGIFLLAYRRLVRWIKRGYGPQIGWWIAAAGLLLLCGRCVLWYGEFLSLEAVSERQSTAFGNINRLRAVREGLLRLREGHLAESVASFRSVLHGSDPETTPTQVARWSGLHLQSLAMVLAFGGRSPLGRQNPAVSFSWDSGTQRLLVLGTDGRLVSLTAASAPVDLGTPLPNAVAVSVSRDGTRIGLVSANGQVHVLNRNGHEAWTVSLAEETYRDLAATEPQDRFLVLREDGGVFDVTPQGARLLSGYPTWPEINPAVSIVATADGEGHYVLDRFGGIHPRGQTTISYNDLRDHAQSRHYWPGRDVGRSIDLSSPDAYPVYLDLYGGVHAVVKSAGQAVYTGNDYPPLDEPIAVDLIVGIVPGMVHILCRDGSIVGVPDRGWLLPPAGEEE